MPKNGTTDYERMTITFDKESPEQMELLKWIKWIANEEKTKVSGYIRELIKKDMLRVKSL